MFFLLRIVFWLGVVCVLLPGGGKKDTSAVPIDTFQAMSAAGAAYSDMRGFCERQAGACVVGGQVAAVLGQRAQDGAKTIVEFISHQMTDTGASTRKDTVASSQDTLTAGDATPTFRVPSATMTQGAMAQVPLPPASPRREAQNRRPAA